MQWLTQLADTFVQLGLTGIFLGMFLESAAIPLPSEIILPFAGYLVFLGKVGWLEAGVVAMLGGTLGAVVSYAVAFWGGRALFARWVRSHEFQRAEAWFLRYGDRAVFFGRLVPGVRTFISLPAGLAQMPFGRFLTYSILGAVPWTVIFMALGYTGGQHWTSVMHYEKWVFVAGAVIVVGWLVWYRSRRTLTR